MRRSMMVALGVLWAPGCDNTVFEAGPHGDRGDVEVAYPANWEGVSDFLEAHCHACHPALTDEVHEDVVFDEGLKVVPGDPEASLLWRVISGELDEGDPDPMPFGTGPLPTSTTYHVRAWIEAGAPVPP